jgi:hypothetical protein
MKSAGWAPRRTSSRSIAGMVPGCPKSALYFAQSAPASCATASRMIGPGTPFTDRGAVTAYSAAGQPATGIGSGTTKPSFSSACFAR